MASLLPGYEYDIFVSYRQKDNKYDGWVTEFITNLKKELEATFKEDISIYFDENPHDGILETHHVDKSLEGKLKCLVLIPILSHTYCDPASFAWQQEFLAFRDLTRTDLFGLDIRLANRNVASRVLPVQIHDLNPEDHALFEKEIGGALRSITFIFKSQGVNRPLTPNDRRNENASRTIYRDQINKTANAVEEIIGAMRSVNQSTTGEKVRLGAADKLQDQGTKWFWSELVRRNVFRAGLVYVIVALAVQQMTTFLKVFFDLSDQVPNILTWLLIGIFPVAMILAWLYEVSPQGLIRTTSPQSAENPYKPAQKKPMTGGVIIALLIGLVIFQFTYFNFNRNETGDRISKNEKSIAVLPFENRSEKQDDEYFADGLTDEIINNLSIIGELRVINRGSIQEYRGKGLSYGKIASELNVSNILMGSVQRSGDFVKITARLIEGATSKYLWGATFQRSGRDVMAVQGEIAQTIAGVLKVRINELEKARLEHKSTPNPTAYDYYLRGRTLYFRYESQNNDQAIEQFKMAIALDPQYALAWAGLGDAYSQMHSRFGKEISWIDSSIVAGKKAIQLDSTLSDAYKALANAYNYSKRYDEAFELLKKAVELNPTNAQAVGNLGTSYIFRGDLPEALRWEKKAAGLNPKNAIPFQIIGWIYRLLGDLPLAESWLEKSLELNANSYWDTYELLAYCYVSQGREKEALDLVPALLQKVRLNSRTYEIAGLIAHFASDKTHAKKYFQQSIEGNVSYRNDPNTVSPIGLGQILLEEGNRVEAEIYLSHALEINLGEIRKGSQDDAPPYNIAGIHAILGHREEALRWLKNAIDAKWIDYAQVEHGPWFSKYRNDPDFLALVELLRKKTEAIKKLAEAY